MGGVLALDIATQCGWALWEGPGRVRHGVYEVPNGRLGRRLQKFGFWLDGMLKVGKVGHLVYEAPLIRPRNGGGDPAALLLLSLAGTACLVAEGNDVAVVEPANNQTVRAHFLGSARGTREELKARAVEVCQQLGFDPKDDNAADALGVLHWALHKHRYPHGLPSSPLFARAGA